MLEGFAPGTDVIVTRRRQERAGKISGHQDGQFLVQFPDDLFPMPTPVALVRRADYVAPPPKPKRKRKPKPGEPGWENPQEK